LLAKCRCQRDLSIGARFCQFGWFRGERLDLANTGASAGPRRVVSIASPSKSPRWLASRVGARSASVCHFDDVRATGCVALCRLVAPFDGHRLREECPVAIGEPQRHDGSLPYCQRRAPHGDDERRLLRGDEVAEPHVRVMRGARLASPDLERQVVQTRHLHGVSAAKHEAGIARDDVERLAELAGEEVGNLGGLFDEVEVSAASVATSASRRSRRRGRRWTW
jgi:hypothetical protein